MAANGKLALCGCVLRPWGSVSWSQANLWNPLFILSVVCESWINTASNWSESPNNHIFLFDLWMIHLLFWMKIIFCLLRTLKSLMLTSSGSMSLNSMPRPVHAMKCALPGSSRRATKNCQSCREPRRWYGAPSRNTLPPSCFTSPEHRQRDCPLIHLIRSKNCFI